MGKRIFLLEDDPIYQDILATDLAVAGYEVTPHVAVTGAAKAIHGGNFDLLIIDIVLPETAAEKGNLNRTGGIQVLGELDDEFFTFPPVIFVSAEGFRANQERIGKLRLNSAFPDVLKYFEKPYDHDALLDAISQIFAQSQGGHSQ